MSHQTKSCGSKGSRCIPRRCYTIRPSSYLVSCCGEAWPHPTYHGGGNIGLAEDNGATVTHNLGHLRIVGLWIVAPRNEAYSGIATLDVEVVLERDREAVKGTEGFASLSILSIDFLCTGNRLVKVDLGEAVGLITFSSALERLPYRDSQAAGQWPHACKMQ